MPGGQTRRTDQEAASRACRRSIRSAAVVADAAGRTLPAGIPRVARAGRRFCRILSDPRSGGGGDPAAGAPLRHGRGDPVRRYPADRAGARAAARFRRGRARSSTGSTRASGIGRLSLAGIASLDPVYETVRRVRARAAGRDGADRVRRGAVDRRDLYGRGRREPRFPSDPKLGLSRSRTGSPR